MPRVTIKRSRKDAIKDPDTLQMALAIGKVAKKIGKKKKLGLRRQPANIAAK